MSFLGLPCLCLCALSYSRLLVFVLFYYIIFYYYPGEGILFSTETQKGGGAEELGGVAEWKTIHGEITFNKRKKKHF